MNIENADNSNYSEATELIKKEEYQEIFEIIEMNEKFMLALGRYQLTPTFYSKEELVKYITENQLTLAFRLSTVIAETQIKLNNEKN